MSDMENQPGITCTVEEGCGKSHEQAISLVTFLVGAGILAYLFGFNQRTIIGDEYLIVNVMWLLMVPCLLIFGLFREDLTSFGVRRTQGDAARLTWIFTGLMIIPIIIAGQFPIFKQTYPLRYAAATDLSALLNWELVYGCYLFSWEFFFRGFLIFGLSRSIGAWPAIILQAIGFGVMHIGKPLPEMISSFFGGIILGWLALRGKSFLPCFAIHWFISILMDIVAIHGRQTGLF